MNQSGQYSKPPLREALLDIQVELPAGFSLNTLEACHEKVALEYPKSNALPQTHARIEHGNGVATSNTFQPMGFRFASADGLQLFQARRDGFTHNRLAPYQGWEPFSQEARRLWAIYREVTTPQRLKRIAVRYINRFDIPGKHVDLKQYFRTSPEIAPDLPQDMDGFFLQVTLPVKDAQAALTLTQTVVPSDQPDVVSIIFDLDLFRTEDIPSSEGELWDLFELFRDKKDAYFEACITDKTRELIR